jgi:hypothetical protein
MQPGHGGNEGGGRCLPPTRPHLCGIDTSIRKVLEMRRLFHVLRELAADFAAARQASIAVSQHRMPSKAALAQLGIAEDRMRAVRF